MTDRERLDDDLAHAPLGPSAANGWATCLDYVNANAGLPDEPTFPAAEGTNAHAISDICLALGFDAADFIGSTNRVEQWEFTWTSEDAGLLQRGLDRVRAVPGQFFGERRVNIEPWTIPGQFGTLDRAVVNDEYTFVSDLKYGRWPVYPVENYQLILYALGFYYDVAQYHTQSKRFILEIDQPRCAGGGGIWETDLQTLLKWGDWLRERAEATQAPNPPRVASEKGCAFCRAKLPKNGGCATYEAFTSSLVGVAPPMPVDGVVITPERRAFILSHRKMISTWLDQLEAAELADYLAGLPTPGRKAVVDTQKGTRDKWANEKAAEAVLVPVLAEESFTKKLITPIQAGKKITSEVMSKLEPHITRGEKGTSMVPLADARQAIPVVLSDDFDEVDVVSTE